MTLQVVEIHPSKDDLLDAAIDKIGFTEKAVYKIWRNISSTFEDGEVWVCGILHSGGFRSFHYVQGELTKDGFVFKAKINLRT